MNYIKKLFFIISFFIEKKIIDIDSNTQINLVKGKKVLLNNGITQSGGNLRYAFKNLFDNFNYFELQEYSKALILGYGIGSSAELLFQKYKNISIEGVEKNKNIIDWLETNNYNLKSKIVNDLAENYIKTKNEFYDLIIIDVFEGEYIPNEIMNVEFINNCKLRLNKNGVLIFNCLEELKNNRILEIFNNKFKTITGNVFYLYFNR